MKSRAVVIYELLRVKQWVKNLLIFGALLFTANLFEPVLFLKTLAGFFLFSFAASGIYIINDIRDAKEDKYHPEKKLRPIASGAVKNDFAWAISLLLIISSLASAYILNFGFFVLLCSYVVMTVFYTFKLKQVVIIDIFIVSAGFVMRAAAGALILNVIISPWLIICTSLLALFVILGKRRYEISTLAESGKHRKILDEYSIPLLDQMISVATASTVIAYSLYTFTSETAAKHNLLMFTIPFVLYGIFRYLYLVHKKSLGGSPEQIFIKDLPMIINIALWVTATALILYTK